VIQEDSYFIVADGLQPTAGIISIAFNTINDLEFTEDYVYGKIPKESP
jgi:hypothetical protein